MLRVYCTYCLDNWLYIVYGKCGASLNRVLVSAVILARAEGNRGLSWTFYKVSPGIFGSDPNAKYRMIDASCSELTS